MWDCMTVEVILLNIHAACRPISYNIIALFITILCIIFGIGDVTMHDDVIFSNDSDLNGARPQFTLTFISIGGPATTVT